MTGHRRATFSLLIAAALAGWPGLVGAEPRAVIELFTSQGCSSCPVADKLMGELSADPSLVTMSLPIDYWDYLGWRDTLALSRHTARQRAYSAVRGDRQVYTPQVVINGTLQALGNDRASIEQAMSRSDHIPGVLSVPMTLTVTGGLVTVTAAQSEAGMRQAEVWLCALRKAIPVTIERGENRGKTITYHDVVRHWVKLGTWTGNAQTWSLPLVEVGRANIDELAAFIQSGSEQKPGVMLGATRMSLH